jgi:hypothetical protein
LRLVETGVDGSSRSVDVMVIGRPVILTGIVKLLGESRDLGELDRAGAGYAACLMPQTSCHAWKARVRSAR